MERISKQSLYQQVLDQLLASILSGEFPAGKQLPSERELMAMVGVGRPSIREALLSLQQMGLIKISHGERARVLRPSPDVVIDTVSGAMNLLLLTSPRGLEELKEARYFIETGLARQAANSAEPFELARLENAIQKMRTNLGDSAAFVAADIEFHIDIAEIGRNSLVVATIRGMLNWLSKFKRDYVSVPGAEALAIAEHERILSAIAEHDPDEAVKAMSDHLKRANDLYRRISQSANGKGALVG